MTRKLKRQLQQALSRNQLCSDKAHSKLAEVESKMDVEGQDEDDEVCQLALNIAELDSKMDE